VIFDEGGEEPRSKQICHKRITIDHDVDLNSHSGGIMPTILRTDKTDPEQVVQSPAAAQPPPTDMQCSKTAPTPMLTSNWPSRTTHTLVRDDDERYTTLSYIRKDPAMQVMVTHAMPDTDEHAHVT